MIFIHFCFNCPSLVWMLYKWNAKLDEPLFPNIFVFWCVIRITNHWWPLPWCHQSCYPLFYQIRYMIIKFSLLSLHYFRLIPLWRRRRAAACRSPASSCSVLRIGPVTEETTAANARMPCLPHHPYPPVHLLPLHHLDVRRACAPR